MKKSLCILHWMPVEYFPPVINMARCFAERDQWDVSVCTNRNHLGRAEFLHPSVKMIHGTFPTGTRGFKRVLAYFSFHIKSLWHLLTNRPDVILYIEPHSALPVFLSRLIWRKPRIFIHYHEYHAPGEFKKSGMRMAQWSNKLEKSWLYPAARWISQTNEDRVRMFLADNPDVAAIKMHVLPNLPPKSWFSGENMAWKESSVNTVIRMVYVGSLSRADTFIEEIIDWLVKQKPSKFTLDIYSYNLHSETRSYLNAITESNIYFHENGIEYDELPDLLRGFHVGLILYKGNTPNYIYNASNKLFEYLACGLDVLYPKQMLGVKTYVVSTSDSRVIECDFAKLKEFNYALRDRVADRSNTEQVFTSERSIAKLENAMLQSISTQT